MVDFDKLLGKKKLTRTIDPIVIFDDLDKESGKEYLRPTQKTVLREWHEKLCDKKDIIVKLHTGQGKTLIGLLMLQSSINEGNGPAMYICPNNYLVTQTVEQAHSFGIEPVQFSEDSTKPPRKFLNSEAILVTNCNKLFNGKSVFGVAGSKREPISLGAIVMDDAHKCLDIIRESFSIRVDRKNSDRTENPLYKKLWTLFEESLERQGPGTCRDIEYGEDRLMAVPFWTWHDRINEVLDLLREFKETEELLFVWDLLKDKIQHCICVFSGKRLEIAPRLLPLELIPSFDRAKRRIFLSATLTEDAFLVRDLGIEPESVSNPLSSGDVKYSGERLILMPTLVNPGLKREKIISWLSEIAARHGNFGVVSIVPSFYRADAWKKVGANVTDVRALYQSIESLKSKVKQKDAKKVLVLVNEYDGIDLPDSTCRILCIDSLPSYSSLIDRYVKDMRPTSRTIRRQQAQRVEQGIGRAIRGSSDWCIVVITGNDLTDFLSEDVKRGYLSNEAQMKINIGEELASEMRTGGGQLDVIEKLVNQCLGRDAGWKEFYKTRMASVETKKPSKEYLKQAVLERQSELLYQQSHFQKAVGDLEKLGALHLDQTDKGWFLQLTATYLYPYDSSRSMELQLKAHTENSRLFLPERGVSYAKLIPRGGARASQIINWIKKHENHNSLVVHVANILDKITYDGQSDLFEEGIDELGTILGFETQRPEKTSGRGPDNLWQLGGKKHWIIECKSGVSTKRREISKREVGQMSNSIGWFKDNYEGCTGTPVMVHSTNILAEGAYATESFWTLLRSGLEMLKKNVTSFCNSLKEISFDNPSPDFINQRLKNHHLNTEDLASYLCRAKKRRES